jgi:hypothetical protein
MLQEVCQAVSMTRSRLIITEHIGSSAVAARCPECSALFRTKAEIGNPHDMMRALTKQFEEHVSGHHSRKPVN